jgi:predicted Na+-dependent transporter
LLFQGLGEILRPALPFFVAMVYALAMIRIDLPAMARRALHPSRVLRTLGLSVALIVVTPVILWAIALALGLPADTRMALVYAHAAPPIASSAGLCLLMGLNAVLALEISIIASLITPLIGPVVVLVLLGDTVALDVTALAARLALIILGGTVAALVVRRTLGADRIEHHHVAFDGITAIGMLLFLLPVFDGVIGRIAEAPLFALALLGLVFATNFGLQYLAYKTAHRVTDDATAGATGILWGNRNVTLYLASVPDNPVFTLYVALYQFPMYFTPLIMRHLYAIKGRVFTGS